MNARLLGAHLSTSGGLLKTLERARELECSCVQIFASNPRGWSGAPYPEAEARAYREAAPGAGVRALVIHAIYLVNPASPKPEILQKSTEALRRDLVSAGRLGALAVVVHPGSDLGEGGGEERIFRVLHELLPDIPDGCRLLLEGMAGTRHSLGDLPTLGRLCRALGPKIGVCLDSAHLCAAGYNLSDPRDFRRLDEDIREQVGYDRVGCLHLNDSRSPCNSRRDLHENLGEGHVGEDGLRRLLHHPPFAQLPFILETPGFDDKGPDEKNLRRLRQYARTS